MARSLEYVGCLDLVDLAPTGRSVVDGWMDGGRDDVDVNNKVGGGLVSRGGHSQAGQAGELLAMCRRGRPRPPL